MLKCSFSRRSVRGGERILIDVSGGGCHADGQGVCARLVAEKERRDTRAPGIRRRRR